ncbi:cation:proton antiporter [Glycomyces algeriensis]|uniref:Na+/H+ antiporter n=1 Tax=Glycomyces algeriensis TaxID=256037 RepID=A0A9W6GB22_9ACTN|nr:cation:proton antiporter [Glycomyces algeriensis]MDA1368840.1 cation:proton antiporter [Glycomyces algeriensis]MDR7350856.1 CPA1 family monovalent cation:H+ antiporter [Glycomyces algeriensis]GLI43567.1 Na+/H+ antiporter [Glycomyces algeriensis]
MELVAILFALAVGGLLLTAAAEWMRIPAPVLICLYGLALGLVPGMPALDLDPEHLLPILLPPILWAAARKSSWRHFAANWRPILFLAVLLVFITTAAVAALAATISPVLPVSAAIVLGAICAPPDAAAVTAVADRLGLPRRLVTILEGEGLFNDVTALTLYNVAVIGVVTGSVSALWTAGLFAYSAVAAAVIGLGVGWCLVKLGSLVADSRVRTALGLTAPYIAYLLADALKASGVLAVICAAFYLVARSNDPDDFEGRLVQGSVWDVLETGLIALTFGLVGMELIDIIDAIGPGVSELLWKGLAVAGAVIAVRALWLAMAIVLGRKGIGWTSLGNQPRLAVVTAWAGMRGVVTVVTALAIPEFTAEGSPFPGREQIQFLSVVVVLATLVAQGLTLPGLIAFLGVRADEEKETAALRSLMREAGEAATERLRELRREHNDVDDEVAAAMERRFEHRAAQITAMVEDREDPETERLAERFDTLQRIEGEMLSAATARVLQLRSSPGHDPVLVDRVLAALDHRAVSRRRAT